MARKFDIKVTTIEEAQNLSTLKVDELIVSLQPFEESINERSKKKNKGVIFVSKYQESEDHDERNYEKRRIK